MQTLTPFVVVILLFGNGRSLKTITAASQQCAAPDPLGGQQCVLADLKLDTIWILDSSAAVGSDDFAAEKAAVAGLFHLLTIDQDYTRVALINMAGEPHAVSDLQEYDSSQEAINATLSMNFYNDAQLDINGALRLGRQLFEDTDNRPDVPNVMILLSSVSVDCPNRSPSSEYPACLTVSSFEDITLVTVSLRSYGRPAPGPFDMSPYSFANDRNLIDNIGNLFCALSPAAPSARPCPCILENLWLDIVVVFDSSKVAGRYNFAAQRAAVIGLLHQFSVNQNKGMVTRIAFINLGQSAHRVSNLTSYEYIADAIQDLAEMQYIGDEILNLQKGLLEAQALFKDSDRRANVRNVVLDFTNKLTDCSAPLPDGRENPCELSRSMRKDGVVIMTIDVILERLRSGKLSDFGHQCFRMSNSPHMMATLEENLCRANCFCASPMTQVTDEDGCEPSAECVYLLETPTGADSADIACRLMGMALADVRDSHKHRFLVDMATTQCSLPFLIGLRYDNDAFRWPNGDNVDPNELGFFVDGEPSLGEGSCVAVDHVNGNRTAWINVPCGYAKPSFYYFCQTGTCDTAHYCG